MEGRDRPISGYQLSELIHVRYELMEQEVVVVVR